MANAPFIFAFMPSGSRQVDGTTAQRFWAEASSRRYLLARKWRSDSALAKNFNYGWSEALNMADSPHGATHFVMLHSDVVPRRNFLDVLMDDLAESGADVLAAVVEIKNRRRLTSTAVGRPDDDWDFRRITVAELAGLPQVFTAGALPESLTEGGRTWLLANTGCWICDLRNPLWRERKADGSMLFDFSLDDRITFTAEGARRVEVLPEDWRFSRLVNRAGGVVAITQRVHAVHVGAAEYPAADVPEAEIDEESIDFHQARKSEGSECPVGQLV